jgi:hypothetical protein
MAAEYASQSEPVEPTAPRPQGEALRLQGDTIGSYDEALDAVVYDFAPPTAASALPDGDEYPYGPRLPYDFESRGNEGREQGNVVGWISDSVGAYFAILNRPPDFVVPKRFGMSAILGIMTALAILFGCLRWMNAWPVFYFFFGVQSLAICLVQMFYGQTPRLASIIAGAIILPLFALAAAALSDRRDASFLCAAIGFVPFGALLGYLTGTCAAGVFLVMDYLEHCLPGQSPIVPSQSSSPAQPS